MSAGREEASWSTWVEGKREVGEGGGRWQVGGREGVRVGWMDGWSEGGSEGEGREGVREGGGEKPLGV